MKVIVGLGNPGKKYEKTRHNIGFMVVAELSRRLGKPALRKKTTAFLREDFNVPGGTLTLIRPLMYMNLSGQALLKTNLNWDALAGETLVVFDEVELDFGRIRIRPSGSAGGHKGMRDIIAALGTSNIPRMRLGVGRDPEADLADYVLTPFSKEEKVLLPDFVSRAADAVESILDDGLESAMGGYNGAPRTGPNGDEEDSK